MSTKGGLLILSKMLDVLSASEKKIASYILQNPQETIYLTAAQLGKKTDTSGATVIRLCKSLKLKGFQDLKLRIVGDMQTSTDHGYKDIEPNESVTSIVEKMTNNSIQTIRETADLLDLANMQIAIDILKNVKCVHFVGVGASGIIAEDAQQKFIRIDKMAYAFSDMHMAAMSVANASENDAVIGISFSGNTPEIAKILRLAKEKNVHTISLTKYDESPVAQVADVNLCTSATREPTFRSGATSSRIAQLQIIDVLFMCVASLQYDETVTHLDATRDAVASFTGSD